MGKGYAGFKKKKLPSLSNVGEFTFTLKKQQDIESQEGSIRALQPTPVNLSIQKKLCTALVGGWKTNRTQQEIIDPPDFFPSESDVDEAISDEEKPSCRTEKAASSATWFGKAGPSLENKKRYMLEKEKVTIPQETNANRYMDSHESLPEISSFMTAREKLVKGGVNKHEQGLRKFMKDNYTRLEESQNVTNDQQSSLLLNSSHKRSVRSGFVPPVRTLSEPRQKIQRMERNGCGSGSGSTAMAATSSGKEQNNEEAMRNCLEALGLDPLGDIPQKFQNIEPRLIEHITHEIMTKDAGITWEDIAGLEHAKRCVMEMVIWPLKRPDLFQGSRAPGKGLLLYGPPGTGKTLIGKAIAGESNATFFSISASSLTSKWIGEGEKLVRALFAVASCVQPAVIFIDEIDSLLSQRKEDGEHESSRRLKTQFLIEMEGCNSGNEQVLLVGATNRPQELDPAVRRRMSNRLYIPLPETVARAEIIRSSLTKDGLMTLSPEDVEAIAKETEGYSGSDMNYVVKEASMAPLREAMMKGSISTINKEDIRDLSIEDFRKAIQFVRPSVAPDELKGYTEWSKQFGSGDIQ